MFKFLITLLLTRLGKRDFRHLFGQFVTYPSCAATQCNRSAAVSRHGILQVTGGLLRDGLMDGWAQAAGVWRVCFGNL